MLRLVRNCLLEGGNRVGFLAFSSRMSCRWIISRVHFSVFDGISFLIYVLLFLTEVAVMPTTAFCKSYMIRIETRLLHLV